MGTTRMRKVTSIKTVYADHDCMPDMQTHMILTENIDPAITRGGAERRRVLLLNATYEPLSAISTRRAIVLMLRERAEMVHDDPDNGPFTSAHISLQAPLVIKLRNYVRVPYRTHIPLTRAALMHRDRFRCAYCGSRADTIDHVIPRSRGGAHSWENCVASCGPCNHRKADKLLNELGWSLRVVPMPPRDRYWRLLSTIKDIHPAWQQYLHPDAA